MEQADKDREREGKRGVRVTISRAGIVITQQADAQAQTQTQLHGGGRAQSPSQTSLPPISQTQTVAIGDASLLPAGLGAAAAPDLVARAKQAKPTGSKEQDKTPFSSYAGYSFVLPEQKTQRPTDAQSYTQQTLTQAQKQARALAQTFSRPVVARIGTAASSFSLTSDDSAEVRAGRKERQEKEEKELLVRLKDQLDRVRVFAFMFGRLSKFFGVCADTTAASSHSAHAAPQLAHRPLPQNVIRNLFAGFVVAIVHGR